MKSLSPARPLATTWTAAYQTPPSMGFSRQEYWSGVPLPSPRQWLPTPVFLPGEFHGQRSLAGCSPCGCEESDTTERLHSHFSLSCIGEGNGNPLQCSCLENPRDGEAWWAAIYGVQQSHTQLKRLRSSSSSLSMFVVLEKVLF